MLGAGDFSCLQMDKNNARQGTASAFPGTCLLPGMALALVCGGDVRNIPWFEHIEQLPGKILDLIFGRRPQPVLLGLSPMVQNIFVGAVLGGLLSAFLVHLRVVWKKGDYAWAKERVIHLETCFNCILPERIEKRLPIFRSQFEEVFFVAYATKWQEVYAHKPQ